MFGYWVGMSRKIGHSKYRTRAIISFGLYFFYPIFTLAVAYIADNLFTKNGNTSFFKPKIRGFYSRAVTDQERVIMARVRYLKFQLLE